MPNNQFFSTPASSTFFKQQIKAKKRDRSKTVSAAISCQKSKNEILHILLKSICGFNFILQFNL
jgi:hypothetical protein